MGKTKYSKEDIRLAKDGNQEAMDRIFSYASKLVYNRAKRYKKMDDSFREDLIQEGLL